MEYNSLYDLIDCLQYGTKIHIGVLFFGNYGNEKCILPQQQTIHTGKICDEFKNRPGGFEKCFKCRNAAIRKARKEKIPFDGLCINGVYEYTRPVVIDEDLACIIFVGNILDEEKGSKMLEEKLGEKAYLMDDLEKNFMYKRCDTVGALIESYIRTLLKNTPSSSSKQFKPIVENIKNYIETNLEYDVKLSQMAKTFQYNEQYLGRFFMKEIHMSFNNYINIRRVERAKILLKETDETVIDIALKVGFNNVTYFNRVFKKYTNMTPTEFRKI